MKLILFYTIACLIYLKDISNQENNSSKTPSKRPNRVASNKNESSSAAKQSKYVQCH